MTLEHGVDIEEVPTGVVPAVQVSPGTPVYIGTAPINSVDLTNVNKPVMCTSLADFTAAFGALSHDFDSWTLHEAASAHFEVFSVGPIVCINVLDPENGYHVAELTGESHQLVNGSVPLHIYAGDDAPLLGIIASTVVVKSLASVTMTLGTDYTLAFDANGFMVVTVPASGSRLGQNDVINVDFHYLDPSGVTTDDVIGGYADGAYTGIEVVEQVYPALRQVPGLLLAPKYSSTPAVAARLAVKAGSINGNFRAEALVDLPTDGTIASAEDAPAWKADNGYVSVDEAIVWPKFLNDGVAYHGSTYMACIANVTDAANNGIPFVSPSNKIAIGTASVLDDGTELLLTKPQANALNAQGIVTFLNGFNGWKLWGNYTAGYPASTDPKDTFIAVRRMFNWIENTIVLTTDSEIDAPVNRRLVDLVRGTIQSFLNGLIAAGALAAGSNIQFLSDDNPAVDLSAGKVTWTVTLAPPSPAQALTFKLQYDPTLLASIFNQ